MLYYGTVVVVVVSGGGSAIFIMMMLTIIISFLCSSKHLSRQLMNRVHEEVHGFHPLLAPQPLPQVRDVAPRPKVRQHGRGLRPDLPLVALHQVQRVEVALGGGGAGAGLGLGVQGLAHPRPRGGPVQRHHVKAGVLQRDVGVGGPAGEDHEGHPGAPLLQGRAQPLQLRQAPFGKVLRGNEHTHGLKNLQQVSAGLDLGHHVLDDHVRQPGQQQPRLLRVLPQPPLPLLLVLLAAAAHHVVHQGPRRGAEADQGHLPLEGLLDGRHALNDVRKLFPHVSFQV
mmetsp:Transcript_18031/g.28167  ORF Transcript_18031/g.28167 Transcript_18031/m.28167 type:complete len:283 (+) Transcript_18031:71-919(+)